MFKVPALVFAIIIILLGIPGIREVLHGGYFSNHDGEGHIIRLQEFDIALKDGHLPPRISKNLMWGYGYYFFNFNYPLVYYLGELVHFLGFNLVSSLNIVTVVTFMLSGVFMFLWQRRHWGNAGGMVAGLLYMYAPYRFLNIYVRGSTAEHIAFVMLPLLFMFTELIAEGKRREQTLYGVLGGLAYGLLMLSHNIMAFIFTIIFGAFMLFHLVLYRRWSVFLHFALVGIIGLGVSSYFWVPSILEKGYVRLDQTIGLDYPSHFIHLRQLWSSSWGFGSSVAGLNDGLSFQVGKLHLILFAGGIGALFYLFRTQKDKAWHLVFYITTFLASVFFMTPVSSVLWSKLPLLPFVQFPWRFLSWSVFSLSVVGGAFVYVLLKQLKTAKIFLSLVFVCFIAGILLYTNREYWKVNMRTSVNLPGDVPIAGSTTWADEQFPIWFEPKPTKVPSSWLEIVEGEGTSEQVLRKANKHIYKVNIQSPAKIVENTAYYPGWKLYVNSSLQKFDYQSKDYPGRMVFQLDKGDYNVELKFEETSLRAAVNYLSLALLGALAAFLGMAARRKQ